MDQLLLALDYGGTKHSAAILRRGERTWAAHSRVLSPANPNARYDQTTVLRMARELMAQVRGRLVAVGVSFGGPVDARAGLVRLSHHVPGWEDVPLSQRLEQELGAPAAVDNDANVAALGEWRFGAGQGADSLLYVTVSTGVGGGWVLGGHIWSGADGMAGEIGHVVVRPGGTPCVCGKRGCVEAEACGQAMARKAIARLATGSGDGGLLLKLAGGRVADVTGELVARAANQGDSLALDVLLDSAAALGSGIAAAANLMNPARVVLGGGVTKAGEQWWDRVRSTARAALAPNSCRHRACGYVR